MKAMIRALRVDLHRCVLAPSFLLSVVLILIWLLLNGADTLLSQMAMHNVTLEQLLNYSLISQLGFARLLPAVAATGYAWSYCQDKSSDFFRNAVSKVGLGAYTGARVVTVALSAFLACAISMALYILFLLRFDFTGGDAEATRNSDAYMNLAADGRLFLFYLARLLVTGLSCSLWAVVGLLVSAYIPNVYVAVASPLIVFYIAMVFGNMFQLTAPVRVECIMFSQPIRDDVWSMIWSVEYLLALIALCGALFHRKLRKERGQ